MFQYAGKGPEILKITWTECAVALCLFALRAASASRTKGAEIYNLCSIRLDFITVTIAIACASVAQAFLTVSVLHGTGNHEDILTVDNIVTANFWSWIAQVCAICGATIGRLAVILFLLCLQMHVNRRPKWILYTVGAATTMINIIEIGLIFRQCQPVQALWDIRIEGNCSFIPITTKVGYFQGSIGALADFTLALYPILIIGPLQQMRPTMKIGLCIIMAGGIVAGIAAINKTVAIGTITKSSDITYATWSLLAWVWSEMWLIIILGSVPPLWPLFKSMTNRARGLSSDSGKESKGTKQNSASYQQFDPDGLRMEPLSKSTYKIQSTNNSRKGEADSDSEKDDWFRPRDQILVTKETHVNSSLDLVV